jgi:L-2-hydroxycarboxylate dehydrogenase (NAD+)
VKEEEPSDVLLASPASLQEFALDVLCSCGLDQADAATMSSALVYANLSGVDSHGVSRLGQYVASLESGRVNKKARPWVVQQEGARALVDGDGGYGYASTFMAARLAADLAERSFVSIVGVRNSRHFGMAGLYAEEIAKRGLVGIVTTTSTALLAPTGASEAVLGNSPISVALPRESTDPIVLDMALSTVAFGWIRNAAVANQPIPDHWAMDRSGQPTTDAREALAARLANPIGGPKGYGLSVVAAALAGVMTGAGFGKSADAHGDHETGDVGHFVVALRPDAFVDIAQYFAGIEQLVTEIKSARRTHEDSPVMLPGEREAQSRSRRSQEGIPVPAHLQERLTELAARLGVARQLMSASAGT